MGKNGLNPALDRTARMLDLVPYLATHQGISVDDLAIVFSISPSEVLDDLTTLWMCGLPGYTALELMDLSFETGYVTISNAETLSRPRMLDRNEVLTLILGLETMLEGQVSQKTPLSLQIGSLIEKLSQFLDVARLIQAGTPSSSTVRGVLEKSISSRIPIEIDYHSLTRDELSTRIIHPLEFTFLNENEYVYAFCELSNGYRTFKVDRIIGTKSVEKVAAYRNPENLSAELPLSRLVVSIKSRERDVAERFNLSTESLQMHPSKEATVESFTPDWAIREIMSFGGEVSLKMPQTLRDSLRQRSQRALGGYN
ncbi:MAG: WYL domain-containing protein [Actinobacteria bacterium]|nr:WYL domain-containing protein [Actinomycetota bacterium]